MIPLRVVKIHRFISIVIVENRVVPVIKVVYGEIPVNFIVSPAIMRPG
jgi:hypothetical protein